MDPIQQPPMGTPAPPGPPQRPVAELVKLPAIFMIIVGALTALYALFGMVSSLGAGDDAAIARLLEDPNLPPALKQILARTAGGAAGALIYVFMLACGGLQIFGGIQLMKLKSRGLVMAAAISGLIPCCGSCCCLGIPVGIWVLVVLGKPEVKESFS